MKNQILMTLSLFSAIQLTAQIQGPRHPGTVQDIDIPGSNQKWVNANNATFSDNDYAYFEDLVIDGSYTNYLVATNFGFNIPGGTTITGIRVEIECSDRNKRTVDYSICILQNGAMVGTDKARGELFPATDNYILYGGPAESWGITWNNAMINDPGFGVAIAVQRTIGDSIPTAGQINNIQITVNFSYLTLPVSIINFTATKQSTSVLLNWKTSSENNMDHYELERSSNGASFSPITTIASLNSTSADYNYTDNHPLPGISYYRLNMKELTGDQKYSQVVAVSFARNRNTTFLYPSPWENGTSLNISNMNGEKLTIYFMNAGGQILSTAVTDSGVVPTETLANRKGLIYYKVLDKAKNQVGTGSLLVL